MNKFYKLTQKNLEVVYSDYVKWCYENKDKYVLTAALCVKPYNELKYEPKNGYLPYKGDMPSVCRLIIKYNDGIKTNNGKPFIEFIFKNKNTTKENVIAFCPIEDIDWSELIDDEFKPKIK